MKPTANQVRVHRTMQKGGPGPYTLIAGMVKDLLAKIDPKGYDELLAGLREEFQPSGAGEQGLVEYLADLSWRLRGCSAMEAEILRKGMRTCPGGEYAPDAMLHAYRQDFAGPDLLSKLSNYETRLQSEFHRTLNALNRSGAGRRRQAAIAAAAKLAKLRPCTSVLQ